MDDWIKKMLYIYIKQCYSHEKEGNSAICDNMDGPWGHIVSEMSLKEKDKYCISFRCGI